MINRRRRASSVSVASRQEEDIADDSTPEQSPVLSVGRKRKRPDPSELCQQLYDSIRNVKKEDGSMLCDNFIRAPKRRQEPSYYEVVANPIDLLRVQQKLKTESYEDVDELTSDIDLLVKNAKAFYKPGSAEYQDATTLWETFNANKAKLIESVDEEPRSKRVPRQPRRSTATDGGGNDGSSEKADDDFDQYEELFASIMTATDSLQDNRALHREFQLLPSKKLYPDYYDVIEHPIDLKLIATKIQTSAYTSLSEMEKDLLQMTRNACTFNEPGSQIYKDAKTLKKIFTAKKSEIESGKAKPTIKKRGCLSALTAALKEEPESSDDEGENSKKFGDGPLWQLFDHLFNAASASDHPNATGAPLGQSLWKLPYRRFHPEYYELIKKPISMAQIQNKLKRGDYANISDLTADLYLMIDNAKRAFQPSNKAHKDAVKMLRIMNAKLLDDPKSSDTEDQEMAQLDSLSTCSTPATNKKKAQIITPPKAKPIILPKKKLLNLQKYLTDFQVNNRKPMTLFMEKPSKKLYPDYYNIIHNPIDMNTIENYIKSERYTSLDELVHDYRLMFSNCRQYNEEGSSIYEDSNTLERALNDKLKDMGMPIERKMTPKLPKLSRKSVTPLETKLRILYESIRDYHEPKGNRQLSLIFMKLPSKNDYPDYYDIIKNPIDMEKIGQKLKSYESVDELASDLLLMFENACKYNEPDSQIYKDALVLQQIYIQTKQSLRDNEEIVPDVGLAVQELLLSLFTALYNHQDDEGRCYSDSLSELPEYDEVEGQPKVRGISLDLIKRRLDKGLYKRLDTFQEDVFACLDRARKLSRTDSQVFEDSIELQTFFIKKRDELCKDILTSVALNYTAMHLSATVEAIRQSKLLQEEQDQDEMDTTTTQGESMTIDQKVYSPGDFVYFEKPENKVPGIVCIERLWTNTENVQMMYGNIFLRPHETYHVASRKFLEQEVFKSDQHQAIQLSKILNKVCVLNVKDYIKMKPEGFADKDVYVCESRYNTKARFFKKMKLWPFTRENDPIKLVPRESTIELKRIMSVFKERVEKHKGELAELQLQEAMVEKEKPNVPSYNNSPEDGNTYFEQYNTICSGVVKSGDYVYVANQQGKQSIAQIQSIWETSNGKSFFQGPWFLPPSEINASNTRTFYRQELLLSSMQDTNPTIAIVGKCSVLDYADYSACRPTEIAESDVYICDSTFDETKKNIKKFTQGNALRKFTHNQMVTPDEIFHFKRPIKPLKARLRDISSQDDLQLADTKDSKLDLSADSMGMLEDSMDGGPPSVNSDIATTSSPAPSIASTPVSTKTRTKQQNKSKSNPNSTFGEISRMVGTDWKNLPATVKQAWEEKAAKCTKDNAIAAGVNDESSIPCGSPTLDSQAPQQIYDCLWDKCNLQFEDALDCMEHCIQEGTGHVQKSYADKTGEIEYHCMWRNCVRVRKNMGAFPHLTRLIKHVREVHLLKGGKNVTLDKNKKLIQRKNPAPSSGAAPSTPATPQAPQASPQPMQQSGILVSNVQNTAAMPTCQSLTVVQPIAPPEPMFVTVPPRPQRVLHSEAYIKYIEGLQNNTAYISPYEKTIRATQASVPNVDASKLPGQWLGHHAQEKPDEVVNALWHLRNFLMKDVIEIKRQHF